MATTLAAGDIAFVSFQSDNTGGGYNADAFQFVLLKSVEAGTTVYFTDNGYRTDTGTYTTTEEVLRWVAQSDLSAGTVITFTALAGGGGVPNTAEWTGINPSTGLDASTANLSLTTSGDNIIALQSPTFGGSNALNGTAIAALHFGASAFASTYTGGDSSQTGLPPGLVDGVSAVSVGNTQNGRYDETAAGSRESGSALVVATSINTDTNWVVSTSPLTPHQMSATFAVPTPGNDTINGDSANDLIDLLAGADIYDGAGGTDTVTGGAGADTLNGGDGDDTFIIVAADLVSGDTIDGGADTDTLQVDGGGTIDLTLASLSNVERIVFTSAAGTNATMTAAQAALISSAAGTTDIVNISGNFNTDTALIKQLLDAGVDQVRWASSVYGLATAVPDPSDSTKFIVTYNDNNLTRPFDYLRTTYDASGNRVGQTQLFDTGLNNGVLQQQEYDPLTGGLISNVYIDSLGTRTFQSVTTDFTNGIRTHTRTINDNNTLSNADDTIVDQYYDASGVITLELTTDASPGGTGKPWVSVAREYSGGVTQIFRTTYDNGNQQVLGTAGAQEIEGGAGADVLIGGAGADVFVFAGSFGNDTVHDYLDGTDKFDFTAFNVDTRAELDAIASITTAGTATLISLNAGGSVKILNLAPAALGDSDFVLI